MKLWIHFIVFAVGMRYGCCYWFHHHAYHHDNHILTSLLYSHSGSSHNSFGGSHSGSSNNFVNNVLSVVAGLFGGNTSSCDGIKEFEDLKNIPTTNPCASITQIWKPLNDLREKNRDCFIKIVQLLAASPKSTRHCACPGFFSRSWSNMVRLKENDFGSCLFQSGCRELAAFFYPVNGKVEQCRTHEFVWQFLRDSGTDKNKLDFIVEHLAATFSKYTTNTCTCREVNPSPQTKQPMVTPTPPTRQPSTTVSQPRVTTTVSQPRVTTTVAQRRTATTVPIQKSTAPHRKVSATPLHQTP